MGTARRLADPTGRRIHHLLPRQLEGPGLWIIGAHRTTWGCKRGESGWLRGAGRSLSAAETGRSLHGNGSADRAVTAAKSAIEGRPRIGCGGEPGARPLA